MLSLFNNEKIVAQSRGGAITLTTDRILYQDTEVDQHEIMLEQITSCQNNFSSAIMLLHGSGICFVLGVLGKLIHEANLENMLYISALLMIVYLPSRRSFIEIATSGTKIRIKASDMEGDEMLDFVHNVEAATFERVRGLNEIEVLVG